MIAAGGLEYIADDEDDGICVICGEPAKLNDDGLCIDCAIDGKDEEDE